MHRGKVLTNLQPGDNKSLTESNIGQLIFFSSRYFSSARAQAVQMRSFMQVLLSKDLFVQDFSL